MIDLPDIQLSRRGGLVQSRADFQEVSRLLLGQDAREEAVGTGAGEYARHPQGATVYAERIFVRSPTAIASLSCTLQAPISLRNQC